MKDVSKHLSRAFLAGIVALLPIGGLVFTVGFAEQTVAGSWLRKHVWYFPGMGLLLAAAFIYLVGLLVTTFVGRWVWQRLDQLLEKAPAVGTVYQTLKQILGYGEGKDAIFERVVMVPCRDIDASELGLVTRTEKAVDGTERLTVFVPTAPTPTSGRMIVIDAAKVQPSPLTVNKALKSLISVGKVGD